MEEAEILSDHVNIMNRGQVICSGSPSKVVSDFGASTTVFVRGGGESALGCLQSYFPGLILEDKDVRVTLQNGRNLVDIIRLLDDSGVRYEEIIVKRPSLEDVFIKLTGENYQGGE
jgi:ABC-2 type transport system ATP-binding protein